VGADDITIDQAMGAFWSDVVVTYRDFLGVPYRVDSARVFDVFVIEANTYENSDDLFVTTQLGPAGDASYGLGVRAFMGQGDDIIDASGVALDAVIQISGFGEVGNDTFVGGAGFDFFYGGEDSDSYVMSPEGSIPSVFEGGGGGNDTLTVLANDVNLFAQTDGTLTANISAGLAGWVYANDVTSVQLIGTGASNVFNVFDLSSTTVTNLLIDAQGNVGQANIEASSNDDAIRVHLADPDLTPNVTQISGLAYATYLAGWLAANNVLAIDGSIGDDTFQNLGTTGGTVEFVGSIGDDTFLVTPESDFAFFTGGSGNDTAHVTGTPEADQIDFYESATGEVISLNGVELGEITQAERLSVDSLAGDDAISILTIFLATGLLEYELNAGDGDDSVFLDYQFANPQTTIRIDGGAGSDSIFSGILNAAETLVHAGSGNDFVQVTSSVAEIYGDAGDDVVVGSSENDTIDGGEGDDYLIGGQGSDQIDGGSGQDIIVWNFATGNDTVDGGTGEDTLVVEGSVAAANDFVLQPQGGFANLYEVLIAGFVVGGGDIEQVSLRGGSGSDSFDVKDLSQTSITLVDLDFVVDQSADSVSLKGTTGNDFILLAGTETATVSGLPWLVRMFGATFSATTLIDGVLIDGGQGEDSLIAGVDLTAPVLVTLKGGAGRDEIRVTSPELGDNADRVTVIAGDESFGDVIQVRNGRNIVFGSAVDVLLFSGTVNDDVMVLADEPGGRVSYTQSTTPYSSSNDLTNFSGVVRVEALGGADEVVISAERLFATVYGGDGNDRIRIGAAGGIVYGEAGSDVLVGSIGDDTMYGGDGDDELVGGLGNDQLFGQAGDDYLQGDLGNDALYGGEDSDLLDPGKNGTLSPEFVDGGSGLDQIRFSMNATAGLIGRTAGFVNVGEFGAVTPPTGFNAVDAENFLVLVDSTVPGSTGYDLTIQDLTGSQVNFVRVSFGDPNDENTLTLQGTIANDVIDAGNVLPPGGEPEAQVLMPWGTVWAFSPGAPAPLNTLSIQGMAGDDVIKVDDDLSQGAFAWKISLDGGDGDDFLSADATIVGGAGNDTLQGGLGADSLVGDDGDDVFRLSSGLDTMDGGGGFDIVSVSGSIGNDNVFTVIQNIGTPTDIVVNGSAHSVDLTQIEQISLQGSTGDDDVFVFGDALSPMRILAILGMGEDHVNTENASVGQVVYAYGEEGVDVFRSGPGADIFYGGDDFDSFLMNPNSFDSDDLFDGGSGFNELIVIAPPIGTTVIASIPSGFEVTNTSYSGATIALNMGSLEVALEGGDVIVSGSNNDDVIRTFDSGSDLAPPLAPETLLITGLPGTITLLGVTSTSTVDIHGQGGDDTFESLGNSGATVNFHGDSGDDRFVVTAESELAHFFGGAGLDTVAVTGTYAADDIVVEPSGLGSQDIVLNGLSMGTAYDAESMQVDALGGNDTVFVGLIVPTTGLVNFEILGGDGDDILTVTGEKSGTFALWGGAGADLISGPDGSATTIVYGGSGNDIVFLGEAAGTVMGDQGDDILFGGEGSDYLDGGEGFDRLEGGLGDDAIEGGSGGDEIFWNDGDGFDLIDGGEGDNLLVVIGASANANFVEVNRGVSFPIGFSVNVNAPGNGLDTANIQGLILQGGDQGDLFAMGALAGSSLRALTVKMGAGDGFGDIAVFDGSIGDDVLGVGGMGADVQVTGLPYAVTVTGITAPQAVGFMDLIRINGLAGYDTLYVNASLTQPVGVLLDGGIGNDTLYSEAPMLPGQLPTEYRVTLMGGEGLDTFIPTASNVVLDGSGPDILYLNGNDLGNVISVTQTGTVLNFTIDGAASLLEVSAYSGLVHLNAGGGNDSVTLSGYDLASSVLGGAGNDTIDASGMAVSVSLYGGAGDDALSGGSGDDFLAGEDGYDELTGNGGFDLIEGGAEGDYIYWRAGDGSDYVDGGTGDNTFVFTGYVAAENRISLLTDPDPATGGRVVLSDFLGLVESIVDIASVQLVRLVGGSASDSITIGDLTGTNIRVVEADFGDDTVPDSLIVHGTDVRDALLLTGSEIATVSGLPWKISAWNAQMDGALLVDAVTVDLGKGDDYIAVSADLRAEVLVNLIGGRGFDEYRINSPVLGANPFRVTVDATVGISQDTIWLYSGRNRVLGSAEDLIMVEGTENGDTVSVTQTVEGTVFDINGVSSTNDLSQFDGVIHVELLGGNDTASLAGYSVPTSVFGGLGNDIVDARGLDAPVSLYGGDGDDVLQGGSANDSLEGGSGNDRLYGNAGDDTVSGGDGMDLIHWEAGDGNDLIDGGEGDDRLVFLGSHADDNRITLTPGSSNVPSTAPGIGRGNANLILAERVGDGSVLGGSIESVQLSGGLGCDKFAVGNLETTDVRVVDVEIYNHQGDAVVSTYATNLPDVITVTADAPDQIGVNGLAVPVRIFGAKPNHTAIVVHAGFGGDYVEVDPQAEAQAIIVVDGGAGNDVINGGSIIIGGPGANVLTGTDGPNTIVGGVGSDTIYGLGGDDKLFGDAEVLNVNGSDDCDYLAQLIILPTATGAPDLIDGGAGNDFINGNVGADTMIGGDGDDEIGALNFNGIFFPEPGNDLIDGGEGDNCVFSGDGDDVVTAGDGSNLIVLGAGNDSAATGDGDNTVFGGAGADTVTTGAGNDVVALGAGDDKATLGSGNDIAWGEDGNDFIIGQYGDDSLYGGAGNDVLWGGLQATPPLKRGQKHAPITPFDGNDVLAGENGFDQLDGGNGDNVMDAGADFIRETMVGSGGWDTAYIHKDEGKFQDVLKNHSKRYTLIPYGSMPVPAVPPTPVDCDSPIIVNVPNPLSGAQSKPSPKKPVKTQRPLPKGASRIGKR
jgi:Ca2+-binding RTX toxin-like protein